MLGGVKDAIEVTEVDSHRERERGRERKRKSGFL